MGVEPQDTYFNSTSIHMHREYVSFNYINKNTSKVIVLKTKRLSIE